MKRIVIDARELRTSTGRYIERLLHYLQRIDTTHEYLILLRPKDIEGWQPTNPNFRVVACPYREFSFGEQLGLARQLYGLRADLVHFGMVQQPLLYFRPAVTTIHDLTTLRFRNPATNPVVFVIKQAVYRVVIWWAAHKSRHLIVPTLHVRDDVAQFARISKDKITVTYESADDFDADPEPLDAFKGKQFIMYNGRPLPHKNLHRLIDAFAVLHRQYPDLYLMIAGKKDRSHRSYEQQIADLGLADRVILTDWITDGQLKWAMQHTAAYIWPPLSEGFGLPPLEAMLQGAPVISSNASCMPEVLGDAVHYFDPTDIQDMAHAIGEVITDKKLQATLVKRGRQQLTHYSWRRMAEQTVPIYEAALGEPEAESK